jgi:hypothetical protein
MSMTRQHLRAIGRKEVNEQAKKRFPGLTRRERRQIARDTEHNSWRCRDKAEISGMKIMHEQAPELVREMLR